MRGYDDATVRSYIMYSNELVDTYGSIKAWEKEDMVVADEPNAAGWLFAGGDIIYTGGHPEVAILIPIRWACLRWIVRFLPAHV